jgi:hypothetical protein
VNNEEQRLTEMLHRVTPEPPRRVTVDDIAFRLANQAGPGRAPRYSQAQYSQAQYRPPRSRRRRYREPRPRRPRWGWAAAPVLAAASVFVVAGASAGIALLATSHHTPSPPPPGQGPATSAPPVSSSPTGAPTATAPVLPVGSPIPGGPWGARLIGHQALLPGTLTSDGTWLYALTGQALVRIDPASGVIVRSAPFSSLVLNPPVVLGGTIWVASSSYASNQVMLLGYDAQTLTPGPSVTVPAVGPLSTAAQGVLAAGPDGNLYVAAGDVVAVVNPASGAVIQRFQQPGGPVNSVAVAPQGDTLYVTAYDQSSQTLRLFTYSLTEGGVETGAFSARGGAGGNLVATSGGVWGTLGTGMSESVWFAPGGDLSSASPSFAAGSGGLASLPSLADGALWIGGTQKLTCADPGTGSTRASVAIPGDLGVAQYFGSVVYARGQAYSYYIDNRSQTQGLAKVSPPAACFR